MQDIQFQQISLPQPQVIKVSTKNIPENESSMSTLSRAINKQDQQMMEQQLARLQKFQDSLGSVVSKLDKSRKQSSTITQSLTQQSLQLQQQIQTYQQTFQKSNIKQVQTQIQKIKKLYISKWQNRISIASQVKVQAFSDIELDDRKSLANQLFKWIVVVIYGQPENKFYWPNFKMQLFQKDQGKDFKERLGKINAKSAKEQQIIKIKDFLAKYKNILQTEEIAAVKQAHPQADKLRQVAEIFLQCNELAKLTAQLQRSIQKDKQDSLMRDQEAMKWKAKHEALLERLQVANQYIKTLDVMQKQLEQQLRSYGLKSGKAREFLSLVKKGEVIDKQELDKYVSL